MENSVENVQNSKQMARFIHFSTVLKRGKVPKMWEITQLPKMKRVEFEKILKNTLTKNIHSKVNKNRRKYSTCTKSKRFF